MDNTIFLYTFLIFLILKFVIKDINILFFLLLSLSMAYMYYNKQYFKTYINLFGKDGKDGKKEINVLSNEFQQSIMYIDEEFNDLPLIKYNINSFLKTYQNIKNKSVEKSVGINDLQFLKKKIVNYLNFYNFRHNYNNNEKDIIDLLDKHINEFNSDNIMPFNF